MRQRSFSFYEYLLTWLDQVLAAACGMPFLEPGPLHWQAGSSLSRWAAREALRCRNFDKAGNPMEQAHCTINFLNVLFSWCDNIPQTDCQHPVWGARYASVIMLVFAPSSLSCPPQVWPPAIQTPPYPFCWPTALWLPVMALAYSNPLSTPPV